MPATATLSVRHHRVNEVTLTVEIENAAGMLVGYHLDVLGPDTILMERYRSQQKAGEAPGYVLTLAPLHCGCRVFEEQDECLHSETVAQLRAEGVI